MILLMPNISLSEKSWRTNETTRQDKSQGYDEVGGIMKTAFEWADYYGFEIFDPDGWRRDNKSMDERISKREFLMRSAISTICPLEKFPDNEYAKEIQDIPEEEE